MPHTPGRWEAIPPKKLGKHWTVGARGPLGGKGSIGSASVFWNVARIDNGAPGDTLATEEANARLIAAAPDLLGALREILNHITSDLHAPEHEPTVVMARAAIAKAEGR